MSRILDRLAQSLQGVWTTIRDRNEAPLRNVVAGFLVLVVVAACLGVPTAEPERNGDEIVVCGEMFDIGTPVVLWSDPGGYDAYSTIPRFEAPKLDGDGQPVRKKRYGERRNLPEAIADRVHQQGWTLADLKQQVTQFVLHFDVCGTSRQCFKILQDKRHLSVHFMLDVDGTIYQTLDLKERAWHGGSANDHSVGIEIAHIGAYTAPGHPIMRNWYEKDDKGLRVKFPKWMKELGIRTEGFVARPERYELQEGEINGRRYWMYDYTKEQREALTKLTAALHRILDIPLDAPRETDGSVRSQVLSADELRRFEGVLGHFHVKRAKNDPGPAMDWERLLREAAR